MDKTAFVDVDTQYDFMKEDGSLYVPGAEGIIPSLAKLVRTAGEKGIPIVGSVDAHAEDDPEFKEFPPHCIKGTPGQNKIPETTLETMRIIPMDASENEVDLSPPGPVILEKRTYDLFDNPHAEAALRATGADRFIVFGVATDICVNRAVEGLLERGYKVSIVTDAVRAVDPDKGHALLKKHEKSGARLVTAEDVIREAAG